jgi:hypothetical protein
VVPVGVEEVVEAVQVTPEVEGVVVVDPTHRRQQEAWLPRTPSIPRVTTTITITI